MVEVIEGIQEVGLSQTYKILYYTITRTAQGVSKGRERSSSRDQERKIYKGASAEILKSLK
jgi:hypothetical protein